MSDSPPAALPLRQRLLLLTEAAFPFVAQQAYIWNVPRSRPRWLDVAFACLVAAIVIAYTLRRGRPTLRTFGLQADRSHGHAVIPIAIFTLAVVGVLLLGGWLTTGQPRGGLRQNWDLLGALLTYPIWGFVQQAVLFGVAYPRLVAVGGFTFAVVGAAALFAFAHLPNLLLMFGAAAMAVAYALVWRTHPSLPVIALSHGLIGAVADKALNITMRVGSHYLG